MNTINLNNPQDDRQLNPQQTPAPTPTLRPGATIPPPPFGGQKPGMRPRPQQPRTGGNTGKHVAAAVGAAAVASGATAAAISMLDGDGAELTSAETIVDTAEDTAAELSQQPQPAHPEPAHAPSGNHPSATPPATPSTPGNGGETAIPDPDPAADTDPVPDPEEGTIEPEDDPLIVPAEDLTIEDPEDIDDIADSLISDEQIDPEDINADDVFTFNDVETVYTVEGDEEVRASFTTNGGDDLVMVDIDNDGLFDRIETPDGFYIDDASQFSLTVSDAENMAQGEGYMAVNEDETEHFDETLGDDYLDDIIEV